MLLSLRSLWESAGGGGVDGTATPAATSGTGAIGSISASGGGLASPASIGGAGALGSVASSGSALAAPSAAQGSGAVQAVATGGGTGSPSSVGATGSASSPAAIGDAAIQASQVAGSGNVQAYGIGDGTANVQIASGTGGLGGYAGFGSAQQDGTAIPAAVYGVGLIGAASAFAATKSDDLPPGGRIKWKSFEDIQISRKDHTLPSVDGTAVVRPVSAKGTNNSKTLAVGVRIVFHGGISSATAVRGVAQIATTSQSGNALAVPKIVQASGVVPPIVAKGDWWPTEEEMAVMLNVMEAV